MRGYGGRWRTYSKVAPKNIKYFHLKMNNFTAVKYCCVLHGRVFVMKVANSHFTKLHKRVPNQCKSRFNMHARESALQNRKIEVCFLAGRKARIEGMFRVYCGALQLIKSF